MIRSVRWVQLNLYVHFLNVTHQDNWVTSEPEQYRKQVNLELACVAWRFKQFEREHTERQSHENERQSHEQLPAWTTYIFHCRPYYLQYFDNPTTGVVVTLRSLSKQNNPMWCLLDGSEGGIERSVNDNCRLCCCLLKISFGEFKHFHAKSF